MFFLCCLALFLPVAANDFATAAQSFLDKIKEGNTSLPIVKDIPGHVKAAMLRPAEKIKPMTARDPLDEPHQVKEMPTKYDHLPEIHWRKPMKESALETLQKDFLHKKSEKSDEKEAASSFERVYEEEVAPGGIAVVGKPNGTQRLYEESSRIWMPMTPPAALCAAAMALVVFSFVHRLQGTRHAPLRDEDEELAAT